MTPGPQSPSPDSGGTSPADSPARLRDLFRRPVSLSAVWAVLPFTLVAAGFGLLPLRSWDYWWHLAMGRLFDARGEVVREAHFLYTMPADAPSFVQPWLSQWALYGLHEAFGLHAVLLLRNGLAAGAFGVLTWWAARRSGSFATGAIASLGGVAFGFLCIAARTHLLAWPLFLVAMVVGYGVRGDRLSRPWLLAFPLLTLLWVNLHGTFLVPALLCLAFGGAELGDRLLGRPRRPYALAGWAGAGIASLGATFLNPRGDEIYRYLLDLPTNPENLATITEWFPTTPWHPAGYGLLFWLLVPTTLGLMLRARRRLDLADLLILVGFSLLAVRHSRALLWVGLSLPIVAAPYLGLVTRRFTAKGEEAVSRGAEILHVVLIAALLFAALVTQPWTADHQVAAALQVAPTRQREPYRGLVPARTPVDALAYLRDLAATAPSNTPRLYHDHELPGFLIYHLQGAAPEQMVWVDNRVELVSAALWRAYRQVNQGRGWREVFDEHRIDAVLASRQEQGPLIEAMRDAPGWRIAFEDADATLFLRADAEAVAR